MGIVAPHWSGLWVHPEAALQWRHSPNADLAPEEQSSVSKLNLHANWTLLLADAQLVRSSSEKVHHQP